VKTIWTNSFLLPPSLPPCRVKKILGRTKKRDWNISSITDLCERRSKLRGIRKKEKKKKLWAHSIDGHYLDDRNKLGGVWLRLLMAERDGAREKGMCPIESTWLVTVIT
jgi:hypothetical protein